MILSLTLNNWKKHQHRHIDFTNGLNGLTGPNWAGKSSILYAILFCLGGAGMVPGSKLITKGMNSGFKQTMEFLVKGRRYRVVRTKTGAKLFDLFEGTRLIADGTTPVNEEIETLMGMSMKRFKQLRYAEQKKTASLLTVGATELHKILEDLTGVNDINDVLAKLSTNVTFLTGEVAGAQVDGERVKGLQESVEQQERRAVELSGQVADIDLLLGQLRADLDAKVEEHSLESRRTEIHQELTAALASSESKVADLRQKLEEVTSARLALTPVPDSEVAAISEQIKHLSEGVGRREQLTALVDKARRKVETVQDELQTERAKMVRTKATLDELEEVTDAEVEEATRIKAEGAAELKAAKERVELGKKALADSACQHCKRPFEGADLQRAQNSLAADEQELKAIWKDFQRVSGNLDDLTTRRLSWKTANTIHQRAEASYHSAEADMDEVKVSLAGHLQELNALQLPDDVNTQLNTLEDQRRESNRLNVEIASLDSKVESLTNGLNEMLELHDERQNKLVNFGPVKAAGEIEAMSTQLTQLRATISDTQSAYNQLTAEKNQLDTSVIGIKAQLKMLEEQQQRAKEATKKLALNKQLQKYLRDNRDRFLQETWNGFMANASAFTSAITGGDISEVIRFENGKFGFKERDAEEMTLSEASGAQESIMGLGVQQAMATASHCGLDLVLMDEPTADMTDEVSMAALQMLATEGRQIIMVSHNRLDTSCFNNLVEL